MRTDFFVAPIEDAAAISTDHMRTPNYASKYLDNAALAALWSAMDASCKYDSLEGEDYLVAMAPPEGPWIFDLPSEMTLLLANLDEPEQVAVAERWAKTEELSFYQVSGVELMEPIKLLHDLAAAAHTKGLRLLLRMAL